MTPSVCKASTGVCCAGSFDVGSSLKAEGIEEFMKHVPLHVQVYEGAGFLFLLFLPMYEWE